MKSGRLIGGLAAVLLLACGASADDEAFTTGPIFKGFGQHAKIDGATPVPEGTVFKISFDVAEAAKSGEINRRFNSLARFINMHAATGVPMKNINVALVVHGGASNDLMTDAAYEAKFDGAKNGNADLLKALMDKGVPVILCGQSAAYHKISQDDLLPGVEIALSAMTAHALLQQDGYTLNPF